jgi:uncharacterized RDD family membrane protein YckC
MLFFESSLLTGVEASAAQKRPVTKTCLQCGAVLSNKVRRCHFCDSSHFAQIPSAEAFNPGSLRENSAPELSSIRSGELIAPCMGVANQGSEYNAAWQGELAHRMEAYRVRKRKSAHNPAQAHFSFNDPDSSVAGNVAVADRSETKGDFAFTLAIGRRETPPEKQHGRMEIDVSIPPKSRAVEAQPAPSNNFAERHGSSYPVASLEERRLAAVIDLVCLLFAYGGFLVLFGSLGGQFTLSKLSAAVYAATFAIVYLQYFALFTIFGGTTPGMMLRGLQVTSFDGDPPQPRQMLWRSVGYVLSAGTFFLGFFWAGWDEDALTWHDRLSRTYLCVAETFATEAAEPARSRYQT